MLLFLQGLLILLQLLVMMELIGLLDPHWQQVEIIQLDLGQEQLHFVQVEMVELLETKALELLKNLMVPQLQLI